MKSKETIIENNVENITATIINVSCKIAFGKPIYVITLDKVINGYDSATNNRCGTTDVITLSPGRLSAICRKHIDYFNDLCGALASKNSFVGLDYYKTILQDAEITLINRLAVAGEIVKFDDSDKDYTIKEDCYIFDVDSIEVVDKVALLLKKKFDKSNDLSSLLADL